MLDAFILLFAWENLLFLFVGTSLGIVVGGLRELEEHRPHQPRLVDRDRRGLVRHGGVRLLPGHTQRARGRR